MSVYFLFAFNVEVIFHVHISDVLCPLWFHNEANYFILNKFSVRELIIEEFFKNVLFLLLHHLSGDCFGKK